MSEIVKKLVYLLVVFAAVVVSLYIFLSWAKIPEMFPLILVGIVLLVVAIILAALWHAVNMRRQL